MHLRDTLRLAFEALFAHKLRTALTLLGLIIGVTSLILVMTVIQGANWYVQTKIANLGTDVFQVSKIPLATANFQEVLEAQKHRDLTDDDLRAIEAGCRLCQAVGAAVGAVGHLHSETDSLADVEVRGETANMGWIGSLTVDAGRFFTESEERTATPVVVLGAEVAQRLFPSRNPLGKGVRIAGEECTVIGVSERIGSVLGQDQDIFAVVPLTVFEKLYGPRHSLVLNVKASAEITPAEDEVRVILRSRRHLAPNAADDFYFASADTYLQLFRDFTSVFFLVFVLISSVASVVGGIVIMNITLVSVTERTKEIGLRRSIGATERDIARQFLVEVLAQCLVGGIAGVALGFGLALLMRQFTPFPAVIRMWMVVLGLVQASAIAVAFGVYPAVKAARLDPVVALRTE
jgi:putative ABC transport system permease protein